MDTDFVDLRIVSLEEEMTAESPENPALRYIFLRLTETPLPIWRSYFKERRAIARHAHWRRAWIDRKYIVVECVPEEIEKYHLRDLKQDVADANQRTRRYLEAQSRTHLEKGSAGHAERERLREMKSRLNFD